MSTDIFINETGMIGDLLSQMNNITGGWFVTLLFIVLVVIAIAFMLRVPLEYTAIFIFPLLLVLMSFTSEFLAVGGVFLIYLGLLLANHFFFRR